MATALSPNKTFTFSITKTPARESQRKTLERLMRMEPGVAKGLRRLALRRKRVDNKGHQRGGRTWVSRVKAVKLVRVEPGQSFTLRVTPQILPDIQSVEKYLEAKPAK
jgi:hypothetical protein